LKSKSNTLHVNLFLAFILRAALSFAQEALFVNNLGFEKDVRRTKDGRLEFIPDGTVRRTLRVARILLVSSFLLS
jgi:hypothetical protein